MKKFGDHSFKGIHDVARRLKKVGISTKMVPKNTSEPGKLFSKGIWFDSDTVYYKGAIADPGDLIHESAHFALLTPSERSSPPYLDGDVCNDLEVGAGFFGAGTEFAVEAWGACFCHCHKIPLLQMLKNFKNDGENTEFIELGDGPYSRVGFSVLSQFMEGSHPGIILLKMAGLIDSFPGPLKRWIVDEDVKVSLKALEKAIAIAKVHKLKTMNNDIRK